MTVDTFSQWDREDENNQGKNWKNKLKKDQYFHGSVRKRDTPKIQPNKLKTNKQTIEQTNKRTNKQTNKQKKIKQNQTNKQNNFS